jgi:uncharacterized membrane protein
MACLVSFCFLVAAAAGAAGAAAADKEEEEEEGVLKWTRSYGVAKLLQWDCSKGLNT